ncbi:MAG: hypothetical protein QOJ65_509 [Fimbriimonadaceae bacterium]|jgi:hypothetical protein|nr:hypothetical protein [Fimbriimonadaceae bacterium]
MTSRTFPTWVWAAAIATALLSLYSISRRQVVESQNRSVSLAVEMENVQALAASQGIPIPQALDTLKQNGLDAVVLSEETISQLVSEGRAAESLGQLSVIDPAAVERVNKGLKLRMPAGDPTKAPVWLVRSVSVGLDPDEAAQVRSKNLEIVARCSNVTGATATYVRGTLSWAGELGAKVFLPMGDQVIGRRDELKTTVETLKALGMMYATPEFTKISGDDTIVKSAPENVVRLHTAQNAELDKMSVDDVVERYSKAARERNMRMLLIRPMSLAGGQPVQDFAGLVGSIRAEIEHEGLAMGPPQPFKDAGLPKWLPVLIALFAVPVAFWIGTVLLPWKWGGVLCGLLMLVLAAGSVTKTGSQLAALAASMAFPTAALISLDMRKLRHPIIEFVITTLLSLVGGLAIAGMLNGLPYYVRAETFPGVKVSVFIPLVITGLYYFSRLTRAREQIQSPITWSAAALGLITVGALAFMIARTGNDAAAGVSGTELQLRSILDRILLVRPRTKEFLIGHPALIIGIGLLGYIKRNPERIRSLGTWATLALTLGAIGQTSVVNTMCHLHTPVVLSLARIAEGIIIGSIIGLVLWLIVKRFAIQNPDNA